MDKPAGLSSAAVVAKVQQHFHLAKIGHAGTLDPMATGVLPLCLNEGTKLATYLSGQGKHYAATLKLGESTETQDSEGEIILRRTVTVTPSQVIDMLAKFVGSINQTPPMYSAKKRSGHPLYELARMGRTVERESVLVSVHALRVTEINLPHVSFEVEASKGFYVRTLCHDIGERLGCGAHMTALRRLSHGPLRLDLAIPLDILLKSGNEALDRLMLPLTDPALDIPLFPLDAHCAAKITSGQALTLSDLSCPSTPPFPPAVTLLRGVDPDNRLRALLKVELNPALWPDAPGTTIALSIERGIVLS